MSATITPTAEHGSHPRPAAAPRRRGRPWRRVLAWGLVVLLAVAAIGWWWASSARLGQTYVAGFESPNATVVTWDAPGSDTWSILIVEPSATATLTTTLTNEGRFGLRIDGVSTGAPPCFMAVTGARLREDPQTMYVDEGPSLPAVGARIPPGGDVGFFVDLGVPDPPCRNDGIVHRDTIELEVTALGRTQRVTMPLMQTFGQSTDSPREVRDFVDVRIQRPR